jgi:hypothetical protein
VRVAFIYGKNAENNNSRLTLVKPLQTTDTVHVEEAQKKWTGEVQLVVSQRLGELLKYVNSVHEIQSLREAAHSTLSELKRVTQGKISVWEVAYRPLLTSRVREIIQHQMAQILTEMKNKLEQGLQDLSEK